MKRKNPNWSTDNPGESELDSVEGQEQTVDPLIYTLRELNLAQNVGERQGTV